LWSATISEVPETPDEEKSREDFQRRGALDRDQIMAMAMAKLAGVDLPETMRRPISGLAPHIPAVAGSLECENGHGCEPGSRFCQECGSPMRQPDRPRCSNGHPVTAQARFCQECGVPMYRTQAIEAAAEASADSGTPAAAAPKRRLKDMRAQELFALARERGIDDTGTRAQVLERLRDAAA